MASGIYTCKQSNICCRCLLSLTTSTISWVLVFSENSQTAPKEACNLRQILRQQPSGMIRQTKHKKDISEGETNLNLLLSAILIVKVYNAKPKRTGFIMDCMVISSLESTIRMESIMHGTSMESIMHNSTIISFILRGNPHKSSMHMSSEKFLNKRSQIKMFSYSKIIQPCIQKFHCQRFITKKINGPCRIQVLRQVQYAVFILLFTKMAGTNVSFYT